MHTFFHYGDQLPFALQVSLRSFVCFVFSHMFCRQKTFLPFVFSFFWLCVGPITTCTNVIGDHLCVLCSRTCCVVKKAFYLSLVRKNCIKSVLMKFSYLMIVCGNIKHVYQFPLWRPITTCVTIVIGDHLCVLYSRTYYVVKPPFALHF